MTESDQYINKHKHNDINHLIVMHMNEIGNVELNYCPNKLIIIDIFMKPEPKHEYGKH